MTLHANLNFIASTTASDSPASYLSAATINNSISTHCEIITPSQITPRKLTRVSNNVSDRCRSCEQAIHPCKKTNQKNNNKEAWWEVCCPCICLSVPISPLRSHWSIQTLCSHARQTLQQQQQQRLLFLPDSMTTRVSVKEWVGTLKLSTLQSGIKWNMMTRRAKFSRLKINCTFYNPELP